MLVHRYEDIVDVCLRSDSASGVMAQHPTSQAGDAGSNPSCTRVLTPTKYPSEDL